MRNDERRALLLFCIVAAAVLGTLVHWVGVPVPVEALRWAS